MSITECLHTYKSLFPNEKEQLKPLFTHIEDHPNMLYHRKTLPGHITGSSIVVQDQHLLCIYHPFIKKWFQPGGHVENGEGPLHGAMREVVEETGLHVVLHPWHQLKDVPFDIDIHYIPSNEKKNEPGHYHYDFRYIFNVDPTKKPLPNELEYQWIPFEDLNDDLAKIIQKLELNGIY